MKPRYLVLVLLGACVFGFVGAQAQERRDRATAVRQVIARNLHFNILCLCQSVTAATVPGVMKSVTPADIRPLVTLLGDRDSGIRVGAEVVLTEFADAAIPALREAEHSADSDIRIGASRVLNDIRNRKKRGV
jgi:hypothetical protein